MAAVANDLFEVVKTRPWFLHFNRRTFFVIPSPRHHDILETRFQQFAEDWGHHLKTRN
jgi:hypothetical protein